MTDIPAKVKADLELIKADVAAAHDHLVDLKTWMAAHLIVIVPVCLMIGWVLGKSL